MKICSQSDIVKFKEFINTSESDDFLLDLSSLNIFECLKFAVCSSVYFANKYPDSKLKCHLPCADIKNLIKTFNVKNFEFV